MLVNPHLSVKSFQAILLIALCVINIQCTTNAIQEEIEIPLLVIKHPELHEILDSLISFEKKCDYYNEELLFVIRIFEHEGELRIHLSSYGLPPKLYHSNEIGVVIREYHSFIVRGEFIDDLFDATDEVRKVNFYIPDKLTSEEFEDILEESVKYTTWYYKYIDNNFISDGKYSLCE
jgi:hypothetical protein